MTFDKKWQIRFLQEAKNKAEWSKYPGTHVGAVIVDDDKHIRASGFNGIPPGVEDTEERLTGEDRYMFTEHGERNAIYAAAKAGTQIVGCSIVVTGHPCADCARAIISSGIIRVYYEPMDFMNKPQWQQSSKVAKIMFEEAGVEVIPIEI